MSTAIRLASPSDAAMIRQIYAPYCELTSAVSFELGAPSLAEIERRVQDVLKLHPWLVFENNQKVTGYAYAVPHRQRAAYRWSVDTSVYVDRDTQGQGVGKALYRALFSLLREQGLINAYAGVTLPNQASVALHTSLGFSSVAVYRKVGYKNGSWHDVEWFELTLQERSDQPAEPISMSELQERLVKHQIGCDQ